MHEFLLTVLGEDDNTIEFYLPVTIVIIPDVLVANLITKLSKPCLLVMTCQTMLTGMKVSITGTQKLSCELNHYFPWGDFREMTFTVEVYLLYIINGDSQGS